MERRYSSSRCLLLAFALLCGFQPSEGLAFQRGALPSALARKALQIGHGCLPGMSLGPSLHCHNLARLRVAVVVQLEAGGGSGGPPRIGCSRSEGDPWWRGDDDANKRKPSGFSARDLALLASLFFFLTGAQSLALSATSRRDKR
jgi:hypothetical protein